MTDRPPSTAEHNGWRRFWDGWPICPACVAAQLSTGAKGVGWPVPVTYDRPIKHPDKCMKCQAVAPDDGPPTYDQLKAEAETLMNKHIAGFKQWYEGFMKEATPFAERLDAAPLSVAEKQMLKVYMSERTDELDRL